MLPYRREARSGAGLPGPLGTWYLGRMVVRCSLPGKNAFVSFLGGVWLCLPAGLEIKTNRVIFI